MKLSAQLVEGIRRLSEDLCRLCCCQGCQVACGSLSLLRSCSYLPSCSCWGSRPLDWPHSPTDYQLWSREDGLVWCTVTELNRWAVSNPLQLLFLCINGLSVCSHCPHASCSILRNALWGYPVILNLFSCSLFLSGSKRLSVSFSGFIMSPTVHDDTVLGWPSLCFLLLTVQLLSWVDSGEQAMPVFWISHIQLRQVLLPQPHQVIHCLVTVQLQRWGILLVKQVKRTAFRTASCMEDDCSNKNTYLQTEAL